MNDEMMIPCDHVIAQLWEYLDEGLDALRSEQVRRHLDMCARCFPEYDFRRAYLRLMRRCSTEPVAPALRRQMFEALLAEEAGAAEMTRRTQGDATGAISRAWRAIRRRVGGD